jgi:hypothetical protein
MLIIHESLASRHTENAEEFLRPMVSFFGINLIDDSLSRLLGHLAEV